MTAEQRILAVQYLRMSTEHQQYSLDNQSAAIQKYAESHGFEIMQTYSDAAKSGLVLKRRHGLRQLLQDVELGTAPYQAILVYCFNGVNLAVVCWIKPQCQDLAGLVRGRLVLPLLDRSFCGRY